LAKRRTLFSRPWEHPAREKRRVVFEAGHVTPTDLLIKEVLDWLDRYLGP